VYKKKSTISTKFSIRTKRIHPLVIPLDWIGSFKRSLIVLTRKPEIMSLFFQPTDKFTKKLLALKQTDKTDNHWAEKAVKSLIKKIKNKNGSLEELFQIITTGNANSRCITIPK
jgi:hypothetical protein